MADVKWHYTKKALLALHNDLKERKKTQPRDENGFATEAYESKINNIGHKDLVLEIRQGKYSYKQLLELEREAKKAKRFIKFQPPGQEEFLMWKMLLKDVDEALKQIRKRIRGCPEHQQKKRSQKKKERARHRKQVEMTDEEILGKVKEFLNTITDKHMKTARRVRMLETFELYNSGMSMADIAKKPGFVKSTIWSDLHWLQDKLGISFIRQKGGASHIGDTNRQGGKVRNINHRPPSAEEIDDIGKTD